MVAALLPKITGLMIVLAVASAVSVTLVPLRVSVPVPKGPLVTEPTEPVLATAMMTPPF